MSNQIFDQRLKEIGDLYEEAKDCLCKIPISADSDEFDNYQRVFELVEKLRTTACTALQEIHLSNEN